LREQNFGLIPEYVLHIIPKRKEKGRSSAEAASAKSRSSNSLARHVRRQALREFTEYIPADSSGKAHGGIRED
jgi:hypothetical protein